MKLRKYLVVGAAVLTAGLLTLQTGTAQATGGGTVNHVKVGATDPIATPQAVTAAFKSGTATFAGFTAGCVGGSVGGTVDPDPGFTFNSLSIVCDTPLGIDATISLASGCSITGDATGTVHNSLIDGQDPKGSKYAPVTFTPFVVASKCVVATLEGGCTFRVDGTIDVQFIEPLKTVSGATYQEIVLKGSGLTTRNANFLCFGLIPNGSTIVLNDIKFNIARTVANAIDFHHAH